MAGIMEDDMEEKEFWSLSTFEQQRYMKNIQDMDKQFKEIQNELKKKGEDGYFPDVQALIDQKEQFDNEIRYWNSKVLSWDTKYEKK